MNAKEFYRIIGDIDDDLILAADTLPMKTKKPITRLWAMAIASCFCFMIFSAAMHFFGTYTVWNEGQTDYVVKSSIPDNSTVQALTSDELSNYFQIALPELLGNELHRTSSYAQIYMDTQNRIVYDRSLLLYENKDGTQSVNLTISRVSLMVPVPDNIKYSRINGTSVTLTEDTSLPAYQLLGAQWEQNGTTIHLSAKGLGKADLIAILQELIS